MPSEICRSQVESEPEVLDSDLNPAKYKMAAELYDLTLEAQAQKTEFIPQSRGPSNGDVHNEVNKLGAKPSP